MKARLELGILGIGNIGTNHARYLVSGQVPGARLAAICDLDGEKLSQAKETFSAAEDIAYYDNIDTFLQNGALDGVIIATPHYFHPELAVKALKSNLHVLSEKPTGVHTQQVKELNDVANQSEKVFGVMFQWRGIDAYAKVKELLTNRALGELHRIHMVHTIQFRTQAYYDSGGWRATWAGEGGGVLFNQAPHLLDIWYWFFGTPTRLRAFCHFGKYHDIEVEDDVTAYMEYENGATGIFIASTGECPGRNTLEIYGENGCITLRQDGTVLFEQTRTGVTQFIKESKERFGVPELWQCEIPAGMTQASNAEKHTKIINNWIDCIVTGSELIAPGIDGLGSVTLANAMLLSTWNDDWVSIPFDDALYYEKLQTRIREAR
ncbi:Gfo/Idh/MocA family protein [Candidatus Hydrogenedentota bacterium]